jgi:two-component system OmpR family response regulator
MIAGRPAVVSAFRPERAGLSDTGETVQTVCCGQHKKEALGERENVLRILLVEDHDRIVEELSSTLEELAQAKVVGTAQAQDEACRWMDERTQACDVAVIDIFLKRGTGLGVLEHIGKYEQPPWRVILTNYATPDMHHRCRELGADAVFDKSTEIEQLIDWLAGAQVRH